MGQRFAVTGVASGIGAELARILKRQGHWVVGFDLREVSENVDQFIQMDLSDPSSIKNAAGHVEGPLDGLCNNAGLPPRAGLEAAILQVNFLGQRQFTSAMMPHLGKGASVVNMASRAGHGWREHVDQIKRLAATPSDGLERFVAAENLDATRAYNLSKEAMILWSVALAEPFVQAGLRVNSLSPGGVATGILDDFKRAFGAKMAANVARAGRPGQAHEVAEIAAFVLSPASHWLKGEDIAIDGGMGAFNMTDMLGLDVLRLD